MGIARAMLAQSLANLGDDTHFAILDEAIHELSIAKSLLPENPFVLAVGLHVHTAAWFMAKRTVFQLRRWC